METRQVVYIHVHYGVHGEMYIGIDSRLIDLSLCCIICSQIKKIRVLVAKRAAVHRVVPPVDHHDSTRGLRIAQMSGQFSRLSAQRRDREWLSTLMKNRGVGGTL